MVCLCPIRPQIRHYRDDGIVDSEGIKKENPGFYGLTQQNESLVEFFSHFYNHPNG